MSGFPVSIFRGDDRVRRLVIISGLLLFAVVLLRTAWLCDDAYITYRVVDNAVHGHGLTWNTDERVQVYTHPLWMLLLIPLHAVARDPYYVAIAVSIVLSLAAVFLLASKLSRSPAAAAFGVTALLFSKAFVDYCTSGLENPLAYLVLAVFLAVYLRSQRTVRSFFYLSLVAAVLLLTRMDLILIVLPALGYRLRGLPKGSAIGAGLLGLAPFFAWEIFSLVYYGFPFPNTAYAKINTGQPRSEMIGQGMYYIMATIRHDPLSLLLIIAGVIAPLAARRRNLLALSAGLVLYVAYVVWIGGGFMSGRFFAPLVLVAVARLVQFESTRARLWAIGAGAVVIVGSVLPPPPLASGSGYRVKTQATYHGIVDERGWYFQNTGLFRADGTRGINDERVERGLDLRRAGGEKSRMSGGVGFMGYYAGPEVRILDVYGLCDPLLARLPVLELDCRIGHCPRATPGYASSWLARTDEIQDPRIAEYYHKLEFVTRGPLFDGARLAEVWRMNTGAYRHLLAPLYEARRFQDHAEKDFDARRFEDVITATKRAVELDPGRGAAWVLMSRAFRQIGDLDNAAVAAQNAIVARGGKYQEDLFGVGQDYADRGQLAEAIAVYQKTLEYDPNNIAVYLALGDVCEQLGRVADAETVYRRALEIDPGNADVSDRLSGLTKP